MCLRPGNSPGRLSNVLRPITMALPIVSALKRLRSAGMRHGSVPPRPITRFCARATTIVIGGLSIPAALTGVGARAKRRDMDAQAQMIAAAGQKLGPKGVVTDPADIEPWLTDWRRRAEGAAPAIPAPAAAGGVGVVVRLA